MLNLPEILKSMPIMYANVFKDYDIPALAYFLKGFILKLRLHSIIFTQRQVVLDIDQNSTAEMPEDADPNGKMILSVCDNGQMWTIDIGNNTCPVGLIDPCKCECPTPSDHQVAGTMCSCTTCNHTIGYVYSPFFSNVNGCCLGAGDNYPIGRVDATNKYGTASINGQSIHFTTNLRNCNVYFLYEAMPSLDNAYISQDFETAAHYYLLHRHYHTKDKGMSMQFKAECDEEISKVAKMWFRKKTFVHDTVIRIATSHMGLIK